MKHIETTDYRVCSKCEENKPLSHFVKDKKGLEGYRSYCKACRSKQSQKYYQLSSKNEVQEKKRVKNHTSLPHRARNLWRAAKARSIKKGLEFTIESEDILSLFEEQEGCCAVSGRKFTFNLPTHDNRERDCFSLDRIDSEKGYTRENLQLVTNQVNIAKSSFPQEWLIELAKNITENN